MASDWPIWMGKREKKKEKEKDFWNKIISRVKRGLTNSKKKKSDNCILTPQIFPKHFKIIFWPQFQSFIPIRPSKVYTLTPKFFEIFKFYPHQNYLFKNVGFHIYNAPNLYKERWDHILMMVYPIECVKYGKNIKTLCL